MGQRDDSKPVREMDVSPGIFIYFLSIMTHFCQLYVMILSAQSLFMWDFDFHGLHGEVDVVA